MKIIILIGLVLAMLITMLITLIIILVIKFKKYQALINSKKFKNQNSKRDECCSYDITLLSQIKSKFKTLWCKDKPHKYMTNTQKFAKQELDILAATVPDTIIITYAKEILALCEKFDKSEQSNGSTPYTATVISEAIKKLLLQELISPVTGHESEWVCVSETCWENTIYQNKRCRALFKDSIGGQSILFKSYYVESC
jgi:hypothetical protein